MNRWRKHCRDLLVVYDETQLYQEARHLALSLGFDAFVFALAVPVSLHRPLFRLYGLPPMVMQENGRDAILRASNGSMASINWSTPGARGLATWLDALPVGYVHGVSQPTSGKGTDLGMASLARYGSPLTQEEEDAIEPKVSYLAKTMHDQLMRIITDRGDLYDPLTAEELTVLRWAAEGKTAEEIAQIMKVPERRVIHRTAGARAKMRASTTIQAAVRAQGYGLL
jgi:LuxR family quorum-sensing system transcriptional regulator SolR